MSEGTKVPDGLQYTPTHEWIKAEGNLLTLGITDHAQSELTDVVFVDLPAVGKALNVKDVVLVLESVKTVAEVYAPASGKVAKVNEELRKNPGLINKDPYGQGWLVVLEADQVPSNLLGAEKYKASLTSH